jgi:predicted flavoprotein YhiN
MPKLRKVQATLTIVRSYTVDADEYTGGLDSSIIAAETESIKAAPDLFLADGETVDVTVEIVT